MNFVKNFQLLKQWFKKKKNFFKFKNFFFFYKEETDYMGCTNIKCKKIYPKIQIYGCLKNITCKKNEKKNN
jgi:hypothetical protein